jgi:hypothetical protein
MAYFKYRMTLQYKNKGETDQYFRKWDTVKVFPKPSPLLKSNLSMRDKDGYYNTRISVYQDNYDLDAYTEKIIISDGGFVVLEADDSSVFDKLSIVWMKCTCTTSPDYRIRFDFIEQVNEAPSYVKMLPRAR